MSYFKIIAIYGLDSTDNSRASYSYPRYFILDSRSDLILDNNFDNTTDAINAIIFLEGQEQDNSNGEFFIPEKISLDIINLIYNIQNKTYKENIHIPHSIKETLNKTILNYIKNKGLKYS